MAKQCLDGQEVSTVFIKMGAKCMAEGMAGKALFPAKAALMCMDVSGEEKGIDGFIFAPLFRKEPVSWFSISKPILCEQVKSGFRQDGIAVLPGLGMTDMDAHVFAVDILIAETAEYMTATMVFKVRRRRNEVPGVFLRRNKGKIGIEPAHGKLSCIPRFMKDIEGEEAELGDGRVDGTVRQYPLMLKPEDVIPQFLLGNVLGRYSNRVEILSRGCLAPSQTVKGFYAGESIPVNQKLSDLFLQLHISERSGRGVPKIAEIYGREAFDIRENSIAVTLSFRHVDAAVVDKVVYKPVDKTELNSTQKRVLTEIRNNSDITQPQLAIKLGLGKTAIPNSISALKKLEYIKRVGSNKRGYWEVKS